MQHRGRVQGEKLTWVEDSREAKSLIKNVKVCLLKAAKKSSLARVGILQIMWVCSRRPCSLYNCQERSSQSVVIAMRKIRKMDLRTRSLRTDSHNSDTNWWSRCLLPWTELNSYPSRDRLKVGTKSIESKKANKPQLRKLKTNHYCLWIRILPLQRTQSPPLQAKHNSCNPPNLLSKTARRNFNLSSQPWPKHRPANTLSPTSTANFKRNRTFPSNHSTAATKANLAGHSAINFSKIRLTQPSKNSSGNSTVEVNIQKSINSRWRRKLSVSSCLSILNLRSKFPVERLSSKIKHSVNGWEARMRWPLKWYRWSTIAKIKGSRCWGNWRRKGSWTLGMWREYRIMRIIIIERICFRSVLAGLLRRCLIVITTHSIAKMTKTKITLSSSKSLPTSSTLPQMPQ